MTTDIFYDAFISYSTRDTEFVTALRLALERSGKRVWQDVKEIELTDEWWVQIKNGIKNADNFLFLLSPRSLASPICHLELEVARDLNKRIIMIRYEDADQKASTRAMTERLIEQDYLKILTAGRDMFGLADANWQSVHMEQNITIRSKGDLLATVPTLVEAFDLDLLYKRQGTLLLARAEEWQASEQNASFLLVGDALRSAQGYLNAGKKPEPTDGHREYIAASQAGEAARLAEEDRARRATQGAQVASAILVVLMVVALIVVGIGGVSLIVALDEIQVAQNEAAIAETQQRVAEIAQAEAKNTLGVVEEQAIQAEATVTQAAEIQAVISGFTEILLEDNEFEFADSALSELGDNTVDTASLYNLRGLLLNERGEYERAIQDYDQALLLDENFASAYNNRGNAYRFLGEYERAIEDFDQALALDENEAIYYHGRGYVYYEWGEYERAIQDYDQALLLDEDFAIAYSNRGLAYRFLGEYERAIQDFEQAIVLDGNNDVFAYNNRGLAYLDLGEYERAIEDFTQALLLDENYAPAYNERGKAYLDLGDYERAVEDFTQAINLEPENLSRYAYRAWAYRQLGDNASALADFEYILAQGGEIPEWAQAEYEAVVNAVNEE